MIFKMYTEKKIILINIYFMNFVKSLEWNIVAKNMNLLPTIYDNVLKTSCLIYS